MFVIFIDEIYIGNGGIVVVQGCGFWIEGEDLQVIVQVVGIDFVMLYIYVWIFSVDVGLCYFGDGVFVLLGFIEFLQVQIVDMVWFVC